MANEGVTAGVSAPLDRLIRKNLVFVGSAYVLGALAGFVAQAFIARELGRAVFGEYVAAFSLVTILGVLYEAAATEYLVRETARSPRRLGELLGDLLLVKLVAGAVVGALAIGIAAALGFSERELAVTGLLAVMLGANAVAKPFRAGLQGIERLGVGSSLAIANSVLSAAGMIVLVATGHGLVTAVAFSALVSLVLVPFSWLALARYVRFSLRGSWTGARSVTQVSFPFTAFTLLTYATNYADAIIIRVVVGSPLTGTYGAAYRLFLVVQFLPAIYLDSVYRTIAHLAQQTGTGFRDFVERSTAAMLLLALPIAAGGVPLADQIVEAVFGSAYAGAGPVFRVLLVSLPLSFPVWILMTAVVLGDRPQSAVGIMAAVLSANIVANIVLVPEYGIVASAWIMVATDAAAALCASVLLTRRGVRMRWLRLAVPALPGVALVGLTALALRDLPLPVPILAGALVYAAALKVAGYPERLGVGGFGRLLGMRSG
jgi:O-antigen/teichoic acid export membrane protein